MCNTKIEFHVIPGDAETKTNTEPSSLKGDKSSMHQPSTERVYKAHKI